MTSPGSRLAHGFAAIATIAFAGIALAQTPAVAPASSATAPAPATTPAASTAAGPAATAQSPATPAPGAACTECGVVKSITAIENRARPTGKSAGARAYAGKSIEAKHTVRQYWSVVVTMDDGSSRNITYRAKPQFREGDRVSMDNPGHHVARIAD